MNLDLSNFLNTSYWAWFGTLYLIILSYQDIKNNMQIDDRKNFFMMGMTFSLISHIPVKIWYILFLMVFIFAFNKYLSHKKIFGEGDLSAFIWIFYGFGLLSIGYLLTFLIFFVLTTVTYIVMGKVTAKYNYRLPFFPALLAVYFVSALIFQLY